MKRDPNPELGVETSASRPLGMKPALALAVLSGFLYFLAFPGVDAFAFAFVALVPLLVALDGQTPRRAAWLGWAAGLTMTIFGFRWLLPMLETFSGFPAPVCALFLVLLCAYQGGRIALLGWLTARGTERGLRLALAFTAAFVASELAYPLVFPWTYAATIHQVPALLQVAELGGPVLVAVTLVCANLAIAEPIRARRAQRPIRWQLALAFAAVPVLSSIYGALRIRAVDDAVARAPHGTVGLVQANMSLLGKRENMAEGLSRHLRLSRELLAQGPVDLLIWSETSVMAPVWEDELSRVIPRVVGRRLGTTALFGAVVARPVSDAREYALFNSALVTDSRGSLAARYDKHYRLPFGEFLPFGDSFPILYEWSPNSGRFAEGESVRPLRIGGHEIATFICYEDVIPSFVRQIVRAGDPDLLANLTNDAWFGDTSEPWIHLALSKLRAVESRRFFARSTNSGVSAVIDPVGRVVAHTGTFEETTLRAPIAWMHGRTVYDLVGDWPLWLLAAAFGVLVLVPRSWRRARTHSHHGVETTPKGAVESLTTASESAPQGAETTSEFRAAAHAWLGGFRERE